jgi:hypothetical protein
MVVPFWFVQRQAKMEPAGEDTFRLTAPNAREAFISIRRGDDSRFSAALCQSLDGNELAVTPPEFERADDAWSAAFELYRTTFIV